MSKNEFEFLAEIVEDLDDYNILRPVYIAMLEQGIPRNQAIEALQYLRNLIHKDEE